jgi:hypothetical protein
MDSDDTTSTSSPYLIRLNYGLAGIKLRQGCIVDGFWTHTFYFALPTDASQSASGGPTTRAPRAAVSVPPEPMMDEGINSSLVCKGPCHQLEGLLGATRTLGTATLSSIGRMTDRIFALLPDMTVDWLHSLRRQPRGLINVIGSVSSYLFGTATNSDVESLRVEIRKILNANDISNTDSARTSESMSTFTRLQNSRLDSMHALMALDQKSLAVLYTEATESRTERALERHIISHAMLELAQFVGLHDGIMEFELGIEDLVHGQITPRLISADQLWGVLQNISGYLSEKGDGGFRLCQNSPQEVYTSPSFVYARHRRDLYIHMRFPYSRHERLNVYRIHTFPMRVPGSQGFVTELQDFPRFVVTNLAKGMVGELSESPRHDYIDSAEIKWHGRGSCAVKLLQDRSDDIHRICPFSARQTQIDPSWLRLSEHDYVLSNLMDVQLVCGPDDQLQPNPFTAPCTLCFMHVHCGCSLRSSAGYSILDTARREHGIELSGCNRNATTRSTVQYTVNLALLHTFYVMANYSISGRDLIDPTKIKDLPPIDWPLFSANTSQIVAKDKADSYSLIKLAANLENNSVVFHSPSEALLYDYIGKIGLQEFGHKEIAISSGVGLLVAAQIFTGCWLYRTRRQMSELSLVVLTISKFMPLSSAFELKQSQQAIKDAHFETLPATSNATINDAIDVILKHFITCQIIYLGLLFCISLCVMMVVFRVLAARRSFLYVEKGTKTRIVQLRLMKFPTANRCYDVRTSPSSLRVSAKNYGFAVKLSFTAKHWYYRKTLTGTSTLIPSTLWLSPWKALTVLPLLHSDFVVSTFIVHTHEYDSWTSSADLLTVATAVIDNTAV